MQIRQMHQLSMQMAEFLGNSKSVQFFLYTLYSTYAIIRLMHLKQFMMSIYNREASTKTKFVEIVLTVTFHYQKYGTRWRQTCAL
jgi:hypothetical protein